MKLLKNLFGMDKNIEKEIVPTTEITVPKKDWKIEKDSYNNYYITATNEDRIYCPTGKDEAERLIQRLNS